MGLLKNIVVGVVGSLIGDWISTLIGIGTYTRFSLSTFVIAIVGAILLLMVVNQFSRRRR